MAAITTAVVAGASAVASYRSGRKASKAQSKANDNQREINRLKNQQAQRAFMRQFRQAQADVITGGVFQGIGLEGSTVQGQLVSNTAQMNTARREFAEMNRLGDAMTSNLNRASRYGFQANTFGQIGSLAMSFASFGPNTSSSGVTTTSAPRPTHDFQGRPINYG